MQYGRLTDSNHVYYLCNFGTEKDSNRESKHLHKYMYIHQHQRIYVISHILYAPSSAEALTGSFSFALGLIH